MRRKMFASLLVLIFVFSGLLPVRGIAAERQNSVGLGQEKTATDAVYGESSDLKERYVVIYRNGAKKETLKKVKDTLKREQKNLKSASVFLTKSELIELQGNVDVASIEPDIQLRATEQSMDWGVTATQVTYAREGGNTGKGIKVAVVDSGIDLNHNDLHIYGGISMVEYTSSFDDDFGHGTHVAGIIGAQDNFQGTVGVAPEAELYSVKVLDSKGVGYLSDVIAGIDWSIENGMDIINLSIATGIHSPALQFALEEAYAKGLLIVSSAGNTGDGGADIDTIQYPAQYNSVIAVGGTGMNNEHAVFSAAGPKLEIAAPAVDVFSTSLHNGYAVSSGTSAAAAYVTGHLALLKSAYPDATNTEIREMLPYYSIDLGKTGRDNQFGWGLISAHKKEIPTAPGTGGTGAIPPTPSVSGDVYSGLVYAAGTDSMVVYQNVLPYTRNVLRMGASTLKDGNVFLSGGTYDSLDGTFYIRNTYIYNSTVTGWQKRSSDLLTEAAPHQVTLADGRVLIIDSRNGYPMIYNPDTDSYTSSNNPLSDYSKIQGMSLLNDGRVFISGGEGSWGANAGNTYIYNPFSTAWLQTASLPVSMGVGSQSTLLDGRVFVTGWKNENGEPVSYIYDPGTNTWSASTPLPVRRSGYRQITLKDGRVVLIGGRDETQKSIYIFDPATSSWSTSPLQFQNPVTEPTLTLLQDGRIAMIGGTELYTPRNKVTLIKLNNPPKLTIINNNQTVYALTGNPAITLSGNVQDIDNDQVTISATIAGVTKSVSIVNASANPTWQLQWNAVTDNIPQGSYSNITVTASDGISTGKTTFTANISVDFNRAPSTPTLKSPLSSSATAPAIVAGTGTNYSWNFADPDAGDFQASYQIIFTHNGTNAVIHDTGWVNSSVNSYTLPTGKLASGQVYKWQVRVRDSKGGISAYSSPSYIKSNTLPVAAFTSYTDGQQIADNILTFTWSYTDADAQTQKQYQIVGSKDNWSTIGYNSGVLTSSQTSHVTTPLTDGTWSFAIQVQDGLEWSVRSYRNNLKLPNALEPNDTAGTAFPVSYGVSFTSLIHSAADVDFFKYIAAANGIDRVVMTVPAGKNFDIRIYDSNMNLIASGIRDAGLAENILFEVMKGGTYYIKITGVNGDFSTTAPYTCTISKMTSSNLYRYEYDGNGNIKSKTVVNP